MGAKNKTKHVPKTLGGDVCWLKSTDFSKIQSSRDNDGFVLLHCKLTLV